MNVGKLTYKAHHWPNPEAVFIANFRGDETGIPFFIRMRGVSCILNFSLALIFTCSHCTEDIMQNCAEYPFPNNCIPALSTAKRKDQVKMYVFISFFIYFVV